MTPLVVRCQSTGVGCHTCSFVSRLSHDHDLGPARFNSFAEEVTGRQQQHLSFRFFLSFAERAHRSLIHGALMALHLLLDTYRYDPPPSHNNDTTSTMTITSSVGIVTNTMSPSPFENVSTLNIILILISLSWYHTSSSLHQRSQSNLSPPG